VTGLGAVTPVGRTVAETWDSFIHGRSGIAGITQFDANEDWGVRFAGEVRNFDPSSFLDVREQRRIDRFAIFALGAAHEAVRDCGFDFQVGDPYRHGVAIGSGIGGIGTIETGVRGMVTSGNRKINPFTVPRLMVNAGAGQVSIRFNLRGSNIATATACATGSHAIGSAFQLIQRGDADVMLAGGAEAAVTPLCIGAFASMKALSTRNDAPTQASRPFDKDRDGFVMGEGAGMLILETLAHARTRGAKPLAEVIGFGSSADSYRITDIEPEGRGAAAAMSQALAQAGIDPRARGSDGRPLVHYISAHGTGTKENDSIETVAVKRVFGDLAKEVPMSSVKSMLGHLIAAAGAVEFITCVLAIERGMLPPTINYSTPDPACDLDYVPNTPRASVVRTCLSNSFGFGGQNDTVCVTAFEG